MNDIRYYLWLTTRSELGVDGIHRVLERFRSPEAAFLADEEEIMAITALRPGAQLSLADKSMDLPNHILEECDKKGIRIVTLNDADYPRRLKRIYQPPVVLYVRGRPLRLDEEAAIAMAGTRHCSAYGRKMAHDLAYDITRLGGIVVTGVVPGCDAAAVEGALKAGGPVVCVLAGGTDIPFDWRSPELYERVVEHGGTLVSEYPPGREPLGRNFPQRNRILTGLCAGVLCVEGSKKSGTMLVAKLAMEQNRDLFAVLNSADRPESAGVLELIKGGAIPVTRGEEVLALYADRFPVKRESGEESPEETEERDGPSFTPETEKAAEETPAAAGPEREAVDKSDSMTYIVLRDHPDEYSEADRAILLALQNGPQTCDGLIELTGLAARTALTTLTLLSLRELVKEEGSGYFRCTVRVREE